MVKRASIGSIVRKRLSDIRTSLPHLKPPFDVEMGGRSAKDSIDHLVKENIALVKLIQDRNKIIEMAGIELKKLRVGVQRVQLQNWNLAQSNTHMLAELHLNKEKVKALQHELICKDAVLKAKSLDSKEAILKPKKRDVKDKEATVGDSAPNTDIKPSKINRKLNATRSRSMGNSVASQQAAEKGSTENKRHCLRRQSACSRMQQQEPATKRLSEFEDIARQYDSLARAQEDNDLIPPLEHKSCCSKKNPLGKPLRRAAGRVQSCKQVPLNVKKKTYHDKHINS